MLPTQRYLLVKILYNIFLVQRMYLPVFRTFRTHWCEDEPLVLGKCVIPIGIEYVIVIDGCDTSGDHLLVKIRFANNLYQTGYLLRAGFIHAGRHTSSHLRYNLWMFLRR